MKDVTANKRKMKELEDNLLYKLSSTKGNYPLFYSVLLQRSFFSFLIHMICDMFHWICAVSGLQVF